ncbi:hypothetical protein [Terriglobus sp.]|uniref:hypothetical protein n=1 Tax=Terriglobus sp. TaxID=1889013 RepID=UPI003AFF958D
MNSTDMINAYRGNAQFQRVADASFRAFEAGLSTHCAEVSERWTDATFVYAGTPERDDQGKLVRVAWEERVPGVACGRSRLYRVRVSIQDGKGSIKGMLPGDGMSSPDLPEAQDAVKAAVRTVLQAHSACQIDVVDTRLRVDGLVDNHAPWGEVWTVNACGRQMKVPVQFTPLAQNGTDIDIEPTAITYAN